MSQLFVFVCVSGTNSRQVKNRDILHGLLGRSFTTKTLEEEEGLVVQHRRNGKGVRSRMHTVKFTLLCVSYLSDAKIWGYGNRVATEKGNYFMHSR